MSVRTLRWVSVIVPTVFVVTFEIITRTVFADVVPSWVHVVVALAAVSLGAFLFSTFVFATMARLEREIRVRNQRLALLNAVASESAPISASMVGIHACEAFVCTQATLYSPLPRGVCRIARHGSGCGQM